MFYGKLLYIYIYITLVLTGTEIYRFTGQIGATSNTRLTPLIYCILKGTYTA